MYEQPAPAPRPFPGPPPAHVPAEQADPRAGIEDAVSGLEDLESLPLAEHVERFDAVHTELTVALSSIDKV
ncbi:MAG: hypothetical protein QOI21_178 [Actinomycetota bacterium]|nr:hypothetical protein [Actinomycetota bacterium]